MDIYDFVERALIARKEARSHRLSLDGFTLVVGLNAWVSILAYGTSIGTRPDPDGEFRFMGMPIRHDITLGEDEIRLRWEIWL